MTGAGFRLEMTGFPFEAINVLTLWQAEVYREEKLLFCQRYLY